MVLAVDVAEDVVGDAEEAVGGVSKDNSCQRFFDPCGLGKREGGREVLVNPGIFWFIFLCAWRKKTT